MVSTASEFSAWVQCDWESATGSRRCGWHGCPVTSAAVAFEQLPLPDRLPVGCLGHGGPQLGYAPRREPVPGWASEEVLAHDR
jgi:hypothetical protein